MKLGRDIYPAILASLPMIILSGFVKKDVWLSLFQNVEFFLFFENVSLGLMFIFLLINIQRGLGKYLFEEYIFNSGKDFPTTIILLHSDTSLSIQIKEKYRKKIEGEFGLHLFSKEEELENIEEAKKIIRDAVNLVRKKVGDGDKTLQYNIYYGFFRNLIGGALLAIPITIFNAISFNQNNNSFGMWVSEVIGLGFLALIIFNKQILNYFGKEYAECLMSEYLIINEGGKNAHS